MFRGHLSFVGEKNANIKVLFKNKFKNKKNNNNGETNQPTQQHNTQKTVTIKETKKIHVFNTMTQYKWKIHVYNKIRTYVVWVKIGIEIENAITIPRYLNSFALRVY